MIAFGVTTRAIRYGGILALLVIAFAASGCSTGKPIAEIAEEIGKTYHPETNVLVPGDILDIKFKLPDWNHQTRVRPDGMASFLGIADLPAAGRTVEMLAKTLNERYSGLLAEPTVSVLLTTLATREVIVMGEVQKPGAIPVDRGRLTLIEAIGRAGGPVASTNLLENTLLVRWDPKEQRQVAWLIDASPEQWTSEAPIYLQPFDVVWVPNKRIVQVDIWVEQHITRLIPIPGGAPISPATGR